MQKITTTLALLFFSVVLLGQATTLPPEAAVFPQPTIDKRVELLSIVFRLAGNGEYNDETVQSYTQDIHRHFDPYKHHPLIRFASMLRTKRGVGFDAVMYMAFHLGEPPLFTPRVDFSATIPDSRWGAGNAQKFVELLRDFYTVTHFDTFYSEHSAFYTQSEVRFLPIYKALNLNWYNQFYGTKPRGSFHVLIAPGNGGGNYGGKVIFPDKHEDAYAVIGTWSVDNEGIPVYRTNDYLPILIHEFNHSYSNPIVESSINKLKTSGPVLYKRVKERMNRQAYGSWQTMLYESMVRAAVIRYMMKNESAEVAHQQIEGEIRNGFYWMNDLVNLLQTYESNRAKYPDLDSFMPIVIAFYNKKAKENYEPASKSKTTMWIIVISIMASGLLSGMICNTYEVQKRKNKELPVK